MPRNKSSIKKCEKSRKRGDIEFSDGYTELFEKVTSLAKQICELKELKKQLSKSKI